MELRPPPQPGSRRLTEGDYLSRPIAYSISLDRHLRARCSCGRFEEFDASPILLLGRGATPLREIARRLRCKGLRLQGGQAGGLDGRGVDGRSHPDYVPLMAERWTMIAKRWGRRGSIVTRHPSQMAARKAQSNEQRRKDSAGAWLSDPDDLVIDAGLPEGALRHAASFRA